MKYRLFQFRRDPDGKLSYTEKELAEEPKLNFGRTPERPPALFIPRRRVSPSTDPSEPEAEPPDRS